MEGQQANANVRYASTMPLALGETAPDFTLKTHGESALEDVTLSKHRGKENVVLLFFPGAYTPVCTKEMCDVTSGLGEYSDLNAVVYGVSTDSPFALDAWAKDAKIGITLLSDYQHEVTKAYDVVWPNFSGLGPCSARAVIVIDKNGVIRHTEQTPTLRDMPDLEKIKQVLAGIS
jgi:peroxiredoxin